VDSFFGVSRQDLLDAGWQPKMPKKVESGKKRSDQGRSKE
jgi:hypothetical protein